MISHTDRADLQAFLAARYGVAAGDLSLRLRRVRAAGLTAAVARATTRRSNGSRELLVVKRLLPNDAREGTAYRALDAAGLAHLAPQVVGTVRSERAQYLCLEYVSRWTVWPWRESTCTGLVLEALATLHAQGNHVNLDGSWDYETELSLSSAYTQRLLDEAAAVTGDARLHRGRGVLRRFIGALPAVRQELLADAVFVHGDVHPGNIRLQSRKGRRRAVLLDWGRARRGSRYEDVASWLQCLRYYEPAAARDHDQLLRRYVGAAGLGDTVTPAHRRAYWLAAGSNALAGALHVHLARVLHAPGEPDRSHALAAAVDWLRIVRRALAWAG